MKDNDAIRQFLGDRPDSEQLREWRETLEKRLHSLKAEKERGGPGTAALESKLQQLERQVAALREEEAVTQFVEDSVRVTLSMGAVADGMDEYEE